MQTEMSSLGESRRIPGEYCSLAGNKDPWVPLMNLSTVRTRMDSLQRFLSESVNGNKVINKDQMDLVSAEIFSAIQEIIVNGAALLACSQTSDLPSTDKPSEKPSEPPDLKISSKPALCSSLKVEESGEYDDVNCDIVELDAVELLAEHAHFCEICGKGFKRDANLRMHMRAHGNQFKTPEALAKPLDRCNEPVTARKTRFSCPFDGCNRNKKHKKFRPLKSVICVRNHFKRSHCPKMYSCNRCNKKSFSVVADLKSHLKHCGQSRWKCSCGTSFSRKDKLFGHMALFEGHMPAVAGEEEGEEKEKGKTATVTEAVGMEEDEVQETVILKGKDLGKNSTDDAYAFFDGLLDGFGSMDGYGWQDVLESPNNGWAGGFGIDEFCGVGP
uniref:Uncharacterized protein MANES_12G133700 n=1 Tax=Rhizophora mucronata TaxID=61149 RepID=A0A2P2IQ61_RHIMU